MESSFGQTRWRCHQSLSSLGENFRYFLKMSYFCLFWSYQTPIGTIMQKMLKCKLSSPNAREPHGLQLGASIYSHICLPMISTFLGSACGKVVQSS